VFLAHYIGGGIDAVLDLYADEFFEYLDAAIELYKQERECPIRVVVAGFENKK
jgi:hypothetical protein